jgi:hypothetical protein
MVDSFSRPSGNATGMYILVNALVAKQLEVLREVVPGATTVAFIDNPTNPFSELRLREIQEAALALGLMLKLIIQSRVRDQPQDRQGARHRIPPTQLARAFLQRAILLRVLRSLSGTWRSSSATQQGSSGLEGAAECAG